MICDQCSHIEEPKVNTVVKIVLDQNNSKKTAKEKKVEFKVYATTARTRRIEQMKQEHVDPKQQQRSQSPSAEKLKKKAPREKRKADVHPYTYEELEIIPVKQFDYSRYKNVRIGSNLGLVQILWGEIRF